MKKQALTLTSVLVFILLLLTGCGGIPNTISSIDDVEGSVIGGLSGTPSIRLAAELGTERAFDSAELMMSELRMGAVDCVIMESTTAAELVANTSGVRILGPLMEYELRIAVPKENARLLTAVDSALEELQRNGTLRGLYNKYFAGRNFTYVPPEETQTGSGVITVALPPDSPPTSFRGDDGRFVGMDVEVVIAIGHILGVELEVLEYDAWELVTAVWHGRADLALGWHPGEGEGLINTSEPYATVVQVVIVRR
jgi:ABC-type amino acid transport substrate-binding protein